MQTDNFNGAVFKIFSTNHRTPKGEFYKNKGIYITHAEKKTEAEMCRIFLR